MPVHKAMADVSSLIYETCKAYLFQQGKFLLRLWVLISIVLVVYFMLTGLEVPKIGIILLFSLIGMAGSYFVAWFGIRINTLANSRTAFASLKGKGWPVCDIPLRAGMSVGMMLISVELLFMLAILLFIPSTVAGACFLGFAIGESLGASALRIAGGIFTKIADIGSDLMKSGLQDQGRRPAEPRCHRRLHRRQRRRLGRSHRRRVRDLRRHRRRADLVHRAGRDRPGGAGAAAGLDLPDAVMMVLRSAASYLVNNAIAAGKYRDVVKFNFEIPLTALVWLTSIVSVILTFVVSKLIIPNLAGNTSLWWQLSLVITCGTLAVPSFPRWSRSSRPRTRSTCARSSPPLARAARR
jgi:K(+)-stimulated pyrophosphate-energized sodium pump